MIFLLILSMTLSQSTSTTQHLLRGPIICSGCLQSLEPWGDVLGDVPIARKAAGLHQIGDGGGDPTRPLIMATAAGPPSSSTSSSSLSSTFHSAAGDVQPGPATDVPHETVVTETQAAVIVKKTLQHGAQDTLDNKCFYCEECPAKFGQKCYMLENQYDPKYMDGVCLGLSMLWVRARGWDGFIETLGSMQGRKIITNIMDGQERFMEKTHFPPNYAKGLLTELYQVPSGEIEIEMVELDDEHPKSAFLHFMKRAVVGSNNEREEEVNGSGAAAAAGVGAGGVQSAAEHEPCIVIVFSKAHAMAIRVTSSTGDDTVNGGTKYHFFDPNYGQFGMATLGAFVDRIWHFVQPPNVPEETMLPAYGNVWAYVRHAETGRDWQQQQQQQQQQGGVIASTTLENEQELGPEFKNVTPKNEPFVAENAAVMPMKEPMVEDVVL